MLVVSVCADRWPPGCGLLTPWTLLGFTFLIGCGTALNNPAWQASVGDMVPRAAPAGGGGAEQRRLQPHPQRRPGDRRPDRRHRRRGRRLRGQRAELHRADRRPLRWRPDDPGQHAPARAARPRDGRRAALRRHVAQHPQGGAARLPLRPDRRGGDGAAAARRAPSRAGRPAHLRRACSAPSASAPSAAPSSARALRERALQRVDRAAGLRRLRALLRRPRAQHPRVGRGARHAARRRLLGAGAGALQHHRAALHPALGGRARRSRSTRPRPSAAWRSGAGSGAASPRRRGPAEALLCGRGGDGRRRRGRASACRCRRGPSSTSTRSTAGPSPRSASTSSRAAVRSRSASST